MIDLPCRKADYIFLKEYFMNTEKIKLSFPIIVEGKYDKAALSAVADTSIITTDGFGIFKSAEKKALLRRLSERGIIVLCDSDGAGHVIRSHIKGIVPKDKLYQLYVPRIHGKEKRKSAPSKEGVLGVEGMPPSVLREIIEKFVSQHPEALCGDGDYVHEEITKLDFYECGLSGGDGASLRRDAAADFFGLPCGMSANSLISALNMISSREEFISFCNERFNIK